MFDKPIYTYTEKLSVPFNAGYELAEFINGVRTLL